MSMESSVVLDIINVASALAQERFGAEPDEGKAIGIEMAEGIRKLCGGFSLYIPVTDKSANMDFYAFLKNVIGTASKAAQERIGATLSEGDEFGRGMAEVIKKLWGGLTLYIPKTDTQAFVDKNRAIFEAWKREGFSNDLCNRFGLTSQRIRQIINQERRKIRECALPDRIKRQNTRRPVKDEKRGDINFKYNWV